MTVGRRLPAEWEPQDFVMLALPHPQTDWCYMLDEVISCYTHIISTILRYQNVVLLCNDTVEARKRLSQEITGTWRGGSDGDTAVMTTTDDTTLTLVQVETNDTWVRDFGGITVFDSLLQEGGQSRRPKSECSTSGSMAGGSNLPPIATTSLPRGFLLVTVIFGLSIST